jgi:RNA polymerase sigma-70 factor (ECF subfamily)
LNDVAISDQALMSAVAAGRIEALGSLVERHQGRALRLARSITGAPELAEDIVQDAFLRVYRAADRYQPSAKFTTWLHRIVVNLCWDHRKRWRPAGTVAPEEPDRRVREPADRLADAETRTAVRRAVAALPERQRLAVVLHRFDGRTMGEVARITGWTESAVESCLVRAYRQLRRDLADLGSKARPRTPQESPD